MTDVLFNPPSMSNSFDFMSQAEGGRGASQSLQSHKFPPPATSPRHAGDIDARLARKRGATRMLDDEEAELGGESGLR